jgi:hypothetical protein
MQPIIMCQLACVIRLKQYMNSKFQSKLFKFYWIKDNRPCSFVMDQNSEKIKDVSLLSYLAKCKRDMIAGAVSGAVTASIFAVL